MTIEIKEVTDLDGSTREIVFVYDGNGGCTQIEKSIYDEQQAAQMEHLTEIVPGAQKL